MGKKTKRNRTLGELIEQRIELNKRRSENFKKLQIINREISELKLKMKGGKKNAT